MSISEMSRRGQYAEIMEKLARPQQVDPAYRPFGDGHAAEKIVRALEEERMTV